MEVLGGRAPDVAVPAEDDKVESKKLSATPVGGIFESPSGVGREGRSLCLVLRKSTTEGGVADKALSKARKAVLVSSPLFVDGCMVVIRPRLLTPVAPGAGSSVPASSPPALSPPPLAVTRSTIDVEGNIAAIMDRLSDLLTVHKVIFQGKAGGPVGYLLHLCGTGWGQ